jgi:pimeloyl-ACP methyl ester carboxylesterase
LQLECWLAQDRLRAAVEWADEMLRDNAPEGQPESVVVHLAMTRVLIVKGVRLPETPARMRSILRQNGYGASLDAVRIANEFVQWRGALTRDTNSMRNERDLVRAIVSWRGWRPGLTFEDAELARVQQPTLYVYGTADPVGTVDLAKRAVDLLPLAELYLVDDGGHLPWFHDLSQVGSHVSRFLAR